MFGIYGNICVQYISGVYHFSWDLTTYDDFVPCVLRASYSWICCIITDQIFGMRAFEGSFNISVGFEALAAIELTGSNTFKVIPNPQLSDASKSAIIIETIWLLIVGVLGRTASRQCCRHNYDRTHFDFPTSFRGQPPTDRLANITADIVLRQDEAPYH